MINVPRTLHSQYVAAVTVTGKCRALFGADSSAETMVPDKPADAESQPADNEEHEAIVHGALAVATRGDQVKVSPTSLICQMS